jgi:hypothetical protein
MERTPCSALVLENGGERCKNGFWTSSPCFGINVKSLPMCLNEKACGFHFNQTGGRPIPLSERRAGTEGADGR